MQEAQETWVQSLGQEDLLEKEKPTHFSILAWEIPWTEEPSGLRPWGCKKSDTTEQPNTHTHTHTYTQDYFKSCINVQFSSVAQSCPTLCDPMNPETQSIESVMPSDVKFYQIFF